MTTDLYIPKGQIGPTALRTGCYTWGEILALVARELHRSGEVRAARVTVKSGRKTVREYLRERFGVVTGPREYYHRPQWTPDRADRQEFLSALRQA